MYKLQPVFFFFLPRFKNTPRSWTLLMRICCVKICFSGEGSLPLLQTLPPARCMQRGCPGRSTPPCRLWLLVSFAEHLLLSSQTSNNPATLTGNTSSCKEKRVETQQLSGRPIYIQCWVTSVILWWGLLPSTASAALFSLAMGLNGTKSESTFDENAFKSMKKASAFCPDLSWGVWVPPPCPEKVTLSRLFCSHPFSQGSCRLGTHQHW